MTFETAQIHLVRDIFAPINIVVAWTPYTSHERRRSESMGGGGAQISKIVMD